MGRISSTEHGGQGLLVVPHHDPAAIGDDGPAQQLRFLRQQVEKPLPLEHVLAGLQFPETGAPAGQERFRAAEQARELRQFLPRRRLVPDVALLDLDVSLRKPRFRLATRRSAGVVPHHRPAARRCLPPGHGVHLRFARCWSRFERGPHTVLRLEPVHFPRGSFDAGWRWPLFARSPGPCS